MTAVTEAAPSAEHVNFLNQAIRDVAASMGGDASPREIASAVVDKLGADALVVFLVDLVADRVLEVLRGQRNAALGRGQGASGRSPKLERRARWWQQMLAAKVHVGGGEWKPLGDCTVDDLRVCVTERKEQIRQTQVQINNYLHLIERMEKHKAKTVAGLDPQQVDL